MLNVKMSSKHIYSSDAPACPKDYIISAHVDALTSVAGIVRNAPHVSNKRFSIIQSEVVDLLKPHLRENFSDQSRKIGPKESILVFVVTAVVSFSFAHIDPDLQTIKAI